MTSDTPHNCGPRARYNVRKMFVLDVAQRRLTELEVFVRTFFLVCGFCKEHCFARVPFYVWEQDGAMVKTLG